VLSLDVATSDAPVSTHAHASELASCPEQLPAAMYAPRAAGTLVNPSRGAAGFRAPVCIALSAAAGCRRYPVPAPLWAADISTPARQPLRAALQCCCVPAWAGGSAFSAPGAAAVVYLEVSFTSQPAEDATATPPWAAEGGVIIPGRSAGWLHVMLPRRWVVCAAASACRDCSKSCPVAVWQVMTTCGIASPVTQGRTWYCCNPRAKLLISGTWRSMLQSESLRCIYM